MKNVIELKKLNIKENDVVLLGNCINPLFNKTYMFVTGIYSWGVKGHILDATQDEIIHYRAAWNEIVEVAAKLKASYY